METVIAFSVLLLVAGAILDVRNSHRIESLRQDMLTPEHLEKTKRSIKDSVNSKIDKTLAAPVEVDTFIQAVIDTFQRGECIETHSTMEEEIIKYIARETLGYEPQAQVNYTPNGRDMRYKSTTFTFKEN